jgi:uncharacterized protein (DUF305 family)
MTRVRVVVVAIALVVAGIAVGAAGGVLLVPAPARPPAAPSMVDIGFSQDMIVHHQQALEIAGIVRGRLGPSAGTVAATIENAQQREIGLMQGWLSAWDAPQVSGDEPMAWMAGKHDHGDAGAPMPGLLTRAELDELGVLGGAELESRFIRLMIRHHQGGVEMATIAVREAALPQVRAQARLMVAEQRKEMGVLSGLLSAGAGR